MVYFDIMFRPLLTPTDTLDYAALAAALQSQLDAIKGENRTLTQVNNTLAQTNHQLDQEVITLRTERDLYKERFLAQQRRLFALRREQRGTEQRDLFFNEAEALARGVTAYTPVSSVVQVPAHARTKRGRKPLDPHLPREVIRHELPESERICVRDGAPLREIGVPFVIGRKNWLFSDTVAGAHASANLYSLIETAKANGIEPYAYLCVLFQALPHATTVDDIEALLPWHIKLPT